MNQVRFAREFFDQLDVLLPIENGYINDRPTRNEFLAAVIHIVLEQFRDHWDELFPLQTNDDYRSFVSTGYVVPAYQVQGSLLADGTVLIGRVVIDFDLEW